MVRKNSVSKRLICKLPSNKKKQLQLEIKISPRETEQQNYQNFNFRETALRLEYFNEKCIYFSYQQNVNYLINFIN